jgi:uncharacterized protein YkwD
MKKLLVVLLVLVPQLVLCQTHRNDTITETFFDVETMNLLMIEEMNSYRVEHGLPKFIVDTTLMRLSNRHTKWMAENDIYCHTSDKRTPYWGDHRRYNFAENCTMGKCIYMWNTHLKLSKNVVGGWKHSEAHSNNILDPTNLYIGVGSYQLVNDKGQKCQYFVAQFRSFQ